MLDPSQFTEPSLSRAIPHIHTHVHTHFARGRAGFKAEEAGVAAGQGLLGAVHGAGDAVGRRRGQRRQPVGPEKEEEEGLGCLLVAFPPPNEMMIPTGCLIEYMSVCVCVVC